MSNTNEIELRVYRRGCNLRFAKLTAEGYVRIPVAEAQRIIMAAVYGCAVDESELWPVSLAPLDRFIAEHCHEVAGECVLFTEFYEKFLASLDANSRGEWRHKKKVREALPAWLPYGEGKNRHRSIGNLSFAKVEPAKPRLIAIGGKLVHANCSSPRLAYHP